MKQESRNELIARHLQGKCTQAEQQEMDAWLANDAAHQHHYKEIDFIETQLKGMDLNFDPNTTEEWKKLKSQLEFKEAKVVQMNPMRRLMRIAAVFIVLLVSGFLLFQTFQENDAPLAQEIIAVKGETKKVNLPDGTIVHLNADSKLTVAPNFNIENRDLALAGEAYFEVAKNTSLPMIITTGEIQTKVVGTAFNLKAHGQDNVEIAVTEGIVEFSKENEMLQLTANKAAKFDDGKLEEIPFNSKDLAWQSGELYFENVALTDIFIALERKFGVTINDQSNMGQTPMTDEIAASEDLKEILERLKMVVDFDYQISGKQITIK